jgi:hypothetical protein
VGTRGYSAWAAEGEIGMEFKIWLESVVKFSNINDAIKKTLEFVVDDGRWEFEPKAYGLSGIKTVTVAGHFYCNKGHFFLTANTVAEKPINSYNAISGEIDSNSKVEIIGSLCIILGKNSLGGLNLKRVAERSNTSGGRLHTPYQLALWVKEVIDNWGSDDGGDDIPTPIPQDANLISV